MNSKNFDEHMYYVLDNFTKGGTPLTALIGEKIEWQVTTIVAGLLANPNIAATMEADELVEAAITYANIIGEKLGQYKASQMHSLERLMDQ